MYRTNTRSSSVAGLSSNSQDASLAASGPVIGTVNGLPVFRCTRPMLMESQSTSAILRPITSHALSPHVRDSRVIAASLDGTDREAHASSKRRCSSSGNVPAIAWVLRMPARPIASARSSRPSHLNNGRRSDAACRIDDSDQRERSPAMNPSTCEPSEPSNDTTP